MSYSTINRCAGDGAFVARVTAAIAQEQVARSEPVAPTALLEPLRWSIAAAADVEAAYASALEAGNADPGGDEAVVTDAMILAHTQAGWPAS